MTWTKLGREFFDECARAGLSDAAVRTHAEGIGWAYQGEDVELRIPSHLVRRFAGSPDYETAVAELLELGFWASNGTDYAIVHHAEVIRDSLAAQAKKRDRDRRAQGAQRRRARVSADARADRHDDVSADVSASPRPAQEQTSPEQEVPAVSPEHEETLNGFVWRLDGTRT